MKFKYIYLLLRVRRHLKFIAYEVTVKSRRSVTCVGYFWSIYMFTPGPRRDIQDQVPNIVMFGQLLLHVSPAFITLVINARRFQGLDVSFRQDNRPWNQVSTKKQDRATNNSIAFTCGARTPLRWHEMTPSLTIALPPLRSPVLPLLNILLKK